MRKIDNHPETDESRQTQPAELLAEPPQKKPPAQASERRREPRISTNLQARLRFLSPFLPNTFEVQILDVSQNGLGVKGPCRLPVESVVQIMCGRSIILGHVRYCFPLGGGMHQAGISIQECIHAKLSR